MLIQGGKRVILIVAVAAAGFFCGQKSCWAVGAGDVVINEIAWMGSNNGGSSSADASDEWIELFNKSSEPINLTGWFLSIKDKKDITLQGNIAAGFYYLIERTDDNSVPNISADLISSFGYGLSNDGEILILKDNIGNEIDKIDASGGWLFGNNATKATMERKIDGDWQTSQNAGGTPRAVNSIVVAPLPAEQPVASSAEEPGQSETASSTGQQISPNSSLSGGKQYSFGQVVINEFVSDPGDNDVEWMELYNSQSEEIDLSGWWLEDGSKAKTKLSGSLSASGDGRYKVIEKPAGNLNNAGDLIVLYNPSGKVIDQVCYGNWNDGNLEDNAPVAHDPASVARKYDGYNTYNNANDFAVTSQPTKGLSNIIQAEDEVSLEAKASFDLSNDIYISEFLPNPVGDDAKNEFIEIYNAGNRPVNLTGWSLSNETGKKANLEKMATSTLIEAGQYLALYRPKTKIVLHNDQGEVRLYQPLADKAWQVAKYGDAKEGWSYVNANLSELKTNLANNVNTEWVWSEIPTPGAANVIKAVNHAPEVKFSFPDDILAGRPVVFDSSDTSDADGDELKYSWDFGDGFKNILASPEHTFFRAGIYQVKLAVSDGQETAEKAKSVLVAATTTGVVLGEKIQPPLTPPVMNTGQAFFREGENGVILNEILPNPKGADAGQEWIELKNLGLDKINLLNWRVENGNSKYKFKNDLWLDAENFYLLTNVVSKLALKNSGDVISLRDDADGLVDQVTYAEAVQGEAYARGENGKWFWTTKLTPGTENIISLANSKSGIMNNELRIMGNAESYVEAELEKVKELEIGESVKTRGVVAVEPGILGAQIFYLVNATTSATSSAAAEAIVDKLAGLQIYNYKKDFPALKLGDEVEVVGELAQTQGELRLKTKDKSDISVKKHNVAPAVLALACDQINEENVGQLISVAGEITSKKSSTIYLDDGSDEILVYFKKGASLSSKNLAAGQAVAVTGVLSKTTSGLRLLPRYQTDIVKINQISELEPQVLGEAAAASEWTLAQRDKKLELFKYLLIVAGGVIMVLAGLFVRAAKKK